MPKGSSRLSDFEVILFVSELRFDLARILGHASLTCLSARRSVHTALPLRASPTVAAALTTGRNMGADDEPLLKSNGVAAAADSSAAAPAATVSAPATAATKVAAPAAAPATAKATGAKGKAPSAAPPAKPPPWLKPPPPARMTAPD